MADEISLNIDKLMSTVILANSVQLANIDSIMETSCNTVATLTISGWGGEAKDAFIEQFSGFKQEMRAFYENIQAFNETLKTIRDSGAAVYQNGSSLRSAL
jgi:uncharacterized protein YukE